MSILLLLFVTLFTFVAHAHEQHQSIDASCRGPPPAHLEERRRRSRYFQPLDTDSDGIVRTEKACKTKSGVTCDLCCNGICCEDLSFAPIFPKELTDSSNRTAQLWIPVRFALISENPIPEINENKTAEQLEILNRAYHRLGIWFYFDSLERFADQRMVKACNTDPCYVSVNCDFYTYLVPRVKKNNDFVITYVMCDLNYLGEAQWPWASIEDSPLQYIQIAYKVLGYGSKWYTPPGGGFGTTGIHEMGHYFGLLHTFERDGVCDAEDEGDWVLDTPVSSRRAQRSDPCGFVSDSCPAQPGLDDNSNWMNYAIDNCSTHFTPGQYTRIQQGFRHYRPRLFRNSLVRGGNCSMSARSMKECSCLDPQKNPESKCLLDFGVPVPTSDAFTSPPSVNDGLFSDSPMTSAPSSSSSGLSSGESNALIILGSIVGVVLLIGIVIGIVWWCWRRNDTADSRTAQSRRAGAVTAPVEDGVHMNEPTSAKIKPKTPTTTAATSSLSSEKKGSPKLLGEQQQSSQLNDSVAYSTKSSKEDVDEHDAFAPDQAA